MKFSDLPLHHAVLVMHSNRAVYGQSLWEELQKISIANRYFNQTVLDIETAREIISFNQTPYNDEKIALISFNTISLPAQNAMLKVLEEPREGVRFILVTSNKDALIPTVLSRLQIVESKNKSMGDLGNVEMFFEAKPTSRMKLPFIVELLSREDEEGRKDREAIRKFILDLASFSSTQKYINSKFVEEILEMASYASDPSASGKALIEYLALLLPQTR